MGMKIRDIMRPGAFTVQETDSLGSAQRAMTRARVHHLPVMTGGKLVGLLAERDVLATRAHAQGDEIWWRIPVRRAMQPIQTAGPDDSLTEVAGRMAISKIDALAIVDHSKLLGIVTVTDVLEGEVRSAMAPATSRTTTAVDAMTPYPFTVRPDALLIDAAGLMIERHVRHLPVVDSTSTIVGMLSERDLRTAIGDPVMYVETRGRSPAQHRVSEVMTKPAIVVPFDRSLVELARHFADERIGALPVVDKFGALIGIVSYVDALRVLAA